MKSVRGMIERRTVLEYVCVHVCVCVWEELRNVPMISATAALRV